MYLGIIEDCGNGETAWYQLNVLSGKWCRDLRISGSHSLLMLAKEMGQRRVGYRYSNLHSVFEFAKGWRSKILTGPSVGSRGLDLHALFLYSWIFFHMQYPWTAQPGPFSLRLLQSYFSFPASWEQTAHQQWTGKKHPFHLILRMSLSQVPPHELFLQKLVVLHQGRWNMCCKFWWAKGPMAPGCFTPAPFRAIMRCYRGSLQSTNTWRSWARCQRHPIRA